MQRLEVIVHLRMKERRKKLLLRATLNMLGMETRNNKDIGFNPWALLYTVHGTPIW